MKTRIFMLMLGLFTGGYLFVIAYIESSIPAMIAGILIIMAVVFLVYLYVYDWLTKIHDEEEEKFNRSFDGFDY